MDPALWKKAEQLFVSSADLTPAERTAYLEQHCQGDDGLRQAVDLLLRGDRADDPLREVVGQAADRLSSQTKDHWLGEQIGAYTIDSRIAEGGMGLVYLAHRSDGQYVQQVAVKLLATTLATTELRARFVAERQILANLNHPHIAMLFDGGETAKGVPYLVMEYIEGIHIDKYCDDHRLDVDARIRLFVQVCRAIHFAHSNLIIHRDIKPSNILVTTDGEPKLLDFGIAKLLEQRDPEAALTVAGSRMLTPRHASPEQVSGNLMTTASDIYSLGLLLYELLSGSFPYEITGTTSAVDLERTINTQLPRAPSEKVCGDSNAVRVAERRRSSTDALARRLRGDLDTIVLKALRKEPEARYSSALEFADDLDRYLGHRPVIARPPTRGYLMSRYWQRHRTAAIGITATAAALVFGATLSTIGFIQARDAERTARIEAQNAAAISEFLVSLFQEANPNNSSGNERSVGEILEIGLQRVDSELEGSPVIKASVLETLSSVYKARGNFQLSVSLLRRALDYHRQGSSEDLAGRARLLNDLGDLLRIQGEYNEAAELISESLEIHDANGSDTTSDQADAVNNLALAYSGLGRFDDAGATFERALALRQQILEPPDPMIALSLHNLAWHYSKSDDLAKAEQYAVDAVNMRVQVFGEDHIRVASTVELLARIHFLRNNWAAAERETRRSIAIAEKIVPPGHPDIVFPLKQLADVLHAKGEFDEARRLMVDIIEWDRESIGPDHHEYGMSVKALASLLIDVGEYDAAVPLLRDAERAFRLFSESDGRTIENTRTLLGLAFLRSQSHAEAAEMLGIGSDAAGPALADGKANVLRRLAIAEYFLEIDDVEAARQIIDSVLAGSEQNRAAYDFLLPGILLLHGRVMQAADQVDAAAASFRQAREILTDWWGPEHWRVSIINADLALSDIDRGKVTQGITELRAAYGRLATQLAPEHAELRRISIALQDLRTAN